MTWLKTGVPVNSLSGHRGVKFEPFRSVSSDLMVETPSFVRTSNRLSPNGKANPSRFYATALRALDHALIYVFDFFGCGTLIPESLCVFKRKGQPSGVMVGAFVGS